ncbi:hypothetical protein EGH24_10610 [Halonotius terrestris]|uniref:Uncharacterized protein n=1 Tax=Halonotius terrestris TaxID=2487750 RepID=A0A8J8TBB6_9EURY|nr:hypothetical protein [Halonotius terrestris]TQQ79925.1 hypothetical protein EGH24_10610 [Halonotius terrestris]
MNRYLLPTGDTSESSDAPRVPIENAVGIYRIGNGTYTVVAETADEILDLGVKDATVSRKTAGQPPVELAPTSRGISVRNHGSTNPLTLRTNIKEQQLRIGESATVTDDCFIQVGISVELQATVEAGTDSVSVSELEAKLDESGVSPAAHARILANNLRNASQSSVTEVRKVIGELGTFVAEHPVNDDEYAQVRSDIEQITTRLESKARGLHNTDTLDAEWQQDIDLLSDRIERLYVRP